MKGVQAAFYKSWYENCSYYMHKAEDTNKPGACLNMDTVSKYDIAEVVSHIGAQTLLSSSNRESGVEFGELLARATKNEKAAKVASEVGESGEDLQLSAMALTLRIDVIVPP